MYFIIWNPNSPDPHLHRDSHGFIEVFAIKEDAEEEAKESIDNEHFREFKICNLE